MILCLAGGKSRQFPTRAARVFRGGGWYCYEQFCRVAYRLISTPTYSGYDLGFRLVRTVF